MKTLAVLITCYNRKEITIKCLSNLFSQNSIENVIFDVYLTDDGCTDGTSEIVTQLYPQVHIIRGNGNLYWNRGMYVAWEEAASQKDYDFYLWLNDDTITYPYMLTTLLKNSSYYSDKAIIVGPTQSSDHQKATYGGRLANKKIPIPNGQPVKVKYFNGNIVLIPRYVYHKIGNLDYYFTHSKGDFDYGLRASKAGISSFQIGFFLGECDRHGYLDWCNPKKTLKQRLKALNRPNGMPPRETFYFQRKHLNIFAATFHCFTIYVRCLFPKIWIILKKES